MKIFNAEEVKKCLEDVVGEDKEYALWLLEWAINKRSFDLEEYREQIRAEVIDDFKEYLLRHKKLVREFKTNHVYESVKIEFITDTTAEQLKE